MVSYPTLCQYFINQALEVGHKQFPQSIVYHYMNDILTAAFDINILEKIFGEVQQILNQWRLQIPSKTIQKGDFLNYLRFKLSKLRIHPQKVQIRKKINYTFSVISRKYWRYELVAAYY